MKLGRFDISIDALEITLRENFKNIVTFINEFPLLKGDWRFFTFTSKTPGSQTFTVPHGMGFMPRDIILLSVSQPDSATVTWKYDRFTDKNVVFTTSGPCTIRAYLGRYKELG